MNRQRGFVDVVGLVIGGVVIAVIAGTAYGAWHTVNTWCNAACKTAQTERDTARTAVTKLTDEKLAAVAESNRVRLAWAADSVEAQARAIQAEGERNARFTPIHAAAKSLPTADARIRIPASAVELLDRAVDAGNVTIAGPASETTDQARAPPADPAQPVDVEGVTVWGAQVAQQYAACADQVAGWQDFYRRLQEKQSAQLH